MTTIFFWNLQHLADGSPDTRRAAIEAVLDKRKADLYLFCEVYPNNTYPQPQNFNYRTATSQQLCYGALDDRKQDLELIEYLPPTTVCWTTAGFKGRNGRLDWKGLVDRGVGYTNLGGLNVYVFHAPASEGSAKKAVSFLACALDEAHGNQAPWILIGDLNVPPNKLSEVPVGIRLGDLIQPPNKPTRKNKKLDYALANFAAKVEVDRTSLRLSGSDHLPIWVTF